MLHNDQDDLDGWDYSGEYLQSCQSYMCLYYTAIAAAKIEPESYN